MTKQEIFNAIVEAYSLRMLVHSETNKENFKSITFLELDDHGAIDLVRKLAFEEKNNHEQVYYSNMYTGIAMKSYLSINYDIASDKININQLSCGYRYAGKKKRYYPFKERYNLVTFTDQIYYFTIDKKNAPRRMRGAMVGCLPYNSSEAIKIMLDVDFIPRLPISLKYYWSANDEWSAMETALGYRVPSVFRELDVVSVYTILSTLKNREDVLKYLFYASEHMSLVDLSYNADKAYALLRDMLSEGVDEALKPGGWSIYSWIDYNFRLKKKIELKQYNSVQIEEETRQMAIKCNHEREPDDKAKLGTF